MNSWHVVLIILWFMIGVDIILSQPQKFLSNFALFVRIDRRSRAAIAKRISKDRRAHRDVPFQIYVRKYRYSALFSLYALAYLVAGPSSAFAAKFLKILQ